MGAGWNIAVDRGGTFADVVARDPEGQVHVRKVLAGVGAEEQVVAALLQEGGGSLDELRVGTTVATNALLTGEGASTGLVVTEGFGDLLRIGHQDRPRIFDLWVEKRRGRRLHSRVVEAKERVLADGRVEVALDRGDLRGKLEQLRSEGVESVAIAFLHGYLHPGHEKEAGEIARDMGFRRVSLSSVVAPEVGAVDRAATAVVDAFLTPVLAHYLAGLRSWLPESSRLYFMKSSGGLCADDRVSGVDAVLSGPAGGVVACAAVARSLGLSAVLGLDMGGTSTDVCRWAGELERSHDLVVAGTPIRTPSLDIVTVASGGGSVLHTTDRRLQGGPASAGAQPGPACYGRGGPAALTDANLLLGRLQPDLFPHAFGPDQDGPLDVSAAEAALASADTDGGGASGFVAVANARMAAAISEVSTARGHDPSTHTLLAFGGAAGQHACAVAELLGIRHVVLHPMSGVLSAYGISEAPLLATRSHPVMSLWTPDLHADLAHTLDALRISAERELMEAGASPEQLHGRVRWELRYQGSDTRLLCDDLESFEAEHLRLFGFLRRGVAVEADQVRVEVVADRVGVAPPARPVPAVPLAVSDALRAEQVGFPDAHGTNHWRSCPVFRQDQLVEGHHAPGPLLVAGEVTTVLVDPGWKLQVGRGGVLHLRCEEDAVKASRAVDTRTSSLGVPGLDDTRGRDPVMLELFHGRFLSIATRMGQTLQRLAWSTNIKERLDFSCALFDGRGRLLANAPHIPVHLGAMGETVRSLVAQLADELKPGRSWAVNDPAQGGSHLPDITVITPVFVGFGGPVAFVANRGHHADVGGTTPGSMPPFSSSLREEGVVLDGLLLVDEGVWQDKAVSRALASGNLPVRDPATCIADLQAQVASNQVGVRLVRDLVAREGRSRVITYMDHVLDNGEEAVQHWLKTLEVRSHRFQDTLDDGTPIHVRVQRREAPGGQEGPSRLLVDFDGSGPASSGNLNAPAAVSRAAVLYVLRCLLGRDIPLNDGCLRAVDLRIPVGSILDPPPGAAVVGGNVETSQRIVDVVLGALGVAAASQGTMNNLCFGDGTFGYYETICGGAGAGPDHAGAHAVHTHMTNTRITDPEVLERRYPAILREFSVRRGSGGQGRWSGGDGVRRVIEFTRDVRVSLLSQRRLTQPFGLAGGAPGAAGGAFRKAKLSGDLETLRGCFERGFAAGDQLVIETPGGGGYGVGSESSSSTPAGDRS